MERVRCAIYTRKSTESGLEQSFNSLDAQREASEAFIKSQPQEGWVALEERYDDGGLSGASLERPALQRLLSDISEGKVDAVVVYKVDRLTRSLADFAKLVELFEEKKVSFISVTQQFNTTTSMGRLTLNVLLSFAQFEREVIGERIRDKIAASKAKGLWMGGPVPIGYDVVDKKLVVNEEEAETLRMIYRAYLKLGTVWDLKLFLDREGHRSKLRQDAKGNSSGGKPFSRGQLYRLLSNPLYRGKIAHRGELYDGEHEALMDKALWDAVQDQLSTNRQGEKRRRARHPSLLAGLLFAADGTRLIASHATKGCRRYRYYVSGTPRAEDADKQPQRYSAPEVEKLVLHSLQSWLSDPLRVAGALGGYDLRPDDVKRLLQRLDETSAALADPKQSYSLVRALISSITLSEEALELSIKAAALSETLQLPEPSSTTLDLTFACSLRRRGQSLKLQIDGGANTTSLDTNTRQLIEAISKAHHWWEEISTGQVASLRQLAERENINVSHASRLIRLAFLSPHLVRQILKGDQAPHISVEYLTRRIDLPHDWAEQERLLS
jgi:site-specific DNA recombinase